MKNKRILCLSGSLRKTSYNTALIKALCILAPVSLDVVTFTEMGNLPLFNPDREMEKITAVDHLKSEIQKADGLVIASPEYAHGVSSVLKNALDWLVSNESFPSMPIALINTSPRANHAQIALREVITTMSGNVVENASISVPLLGSDLNIDGIVKSPEISKALIDALELLRTAISEYGDV